MTDFCSFSNKDISLIFNSNHLIFISLNSLFHQLFVDSKIKFHDHLALNFVFDQPLFIFNLNLGVDLQDQLLLKYKLQFDYFGLFGILWLLDFY